MNAEIRHLQVQWLSAKTVMKTYNLFLLGFGTVGRALARLILVKEALLRDSLHVAFRITGAVTRRHGGAADSGGLNPDALLRAAEAGGRLGRRTWDGTRLADWLGESAADVLVELTPTDRDTGEPAVANIRTALACGVHAVTANKGPVAFAYRELNALAENRGRRFLFESAVMDGTPVFSLQRETLPAARIRGFRGILNSTTNYLLTQMESGMEFEEAVAQAQAVGIAETDPLADVDGWDAAFKVAALAAVWMDAALKPQDIPRIGIGGLDPASVRRARAEGRPYKLVCRGRQTAAGVEASVRPEQLTADDPLAAARGTATLLQIESDVLPGVIIGGSEPGPQTTAYGLLADLLRIARDCPKDFLLSN
jgi:homoserine dehydrogenase